MVVNKVVLLVWRYLRDEVCYEAEHGDGGVDCSVEKDFR